MRRIDCPHGGYICLPDEWLGKHLERRDKAREKSREAGLTPTLATFAAAMAMIEDWGEIPSLGSNPEHWDFSALGARYILWISDTVFGDFATALLVPKNSSAPSLIGSKVTAQTSEAPGISESETQA